MYWARNRPERTLPPSGIELESPDSHADTLRIKLKACPQLKGCESAYLLFWATIYTYIYVYIYILNSHGDITHPCLTPTSTLKLLLNSPFTHTEALAFSKKDLIPSSNCLPAPYTLKSIP